MLVEMKVHLPAVWSLAPKVEKFNYITMNVTVLFPSW